MRKFTLFILVVSVFFTSCNKDASVLKVGYAPVADASQLFIGIEKGFFEEEGLTIKLENLESGSKVIEALGANSIDIGQSSYVPIIYAKQADLDFKIIAAGAAEDSLHIENAIIVKKEAGIKTVHDLKGKKVAINGRRTINHMVLEEYLRKYGISPNEVSVIEIPFPRMEMVLQADQVDAICTMEPFVTRTLKSDNVGILSHQFAELFPEIPIACFVATDGWIEKNEKTLNKFKRAFDKATDFLMSNPEESRIIISKYTNISFEEMQEVSLPTFQKTVDTEFVKYLISLMRERQYIDKDIDVKDLVHKYE
jgi:NitT/TauT family transport system substrate-binding protein